MFLTHTNELKILEFSDADINPTKNYQYNGSTPPLVTHPYPLYSPLEDTSVAPDEPPPGPHIEAGDSAIQVCTGDLPYVHLLGAEYMIFGFYHVWLHQKPGNHLDGGITEDGKWQACWKNLSLCKPNAMTYHIEKSRSDFSEPFLWSLTVYELGSGTLIG